MRIFFAHKKGMPDDDIELWKTFLGESLADDGIEPEVISGKEDFDANISSEGNFNNWCRSVVDRVDYESGEPYYSLIVVPDETVGKATAMIITKALNANRPVVFAQLRFEAVKPHHTAPPKVNVKIEPVNTLYVEDARDFNNGWRLGH